MNDLDLDFLGSPFGLSCYEQTAWHPYSETTEIAKALDAAPEAVDSALRDLQARGLVRRVGGSWLAEDILLWLEQRHAQAQVEQARAELERARQLSHLVRSHLPLAYRRGTGGFVADDAETVGPLEVVPRMVELVDQAQRGLWFLLPPFTEGFGRPPVIADSVTRALERGVEVHSVWAPESVATVQAAVGRLPPLGSIRVNPAVRQRAILADDAAVLLPRDDHDATQGALVIVHPATVRLWASKIRDLYAAGQPLARPAPVATSQDRRSQEDALIVRLIAAGATDNAIANRTGIGSRRTVQRRIEDLKARYGASSRVDLVQKAAALIPRTESA